MIAATLLDIANHPAPPLVISEPERAALARAGRTEQRIATRARIVLRTADARSDRRIAAELRVSPMTILLWRRRFEAARLAGLADAPRPGRCATGRPMRHGPAEHPPMAARTATGSSP